MSDVSNVRALREGATVSSDAKAEFMRHVSAAFDEYVAERGYEPDAMVSVFGGVKQTATAFWLVRGESEGACTSVLSLCAMSLQSAIMSRDEWRLG